MEQARKQAAAASLGEADAAPAEGNQEAEPPKPPSIHDEEKDRRSEQRQQKELEKQRKIKSTIFVHDSNKEKDEERDREFFAREQALREKTLAQFKQSLALGSSEPASKRKRKGEAQAKGERKRRKSPQKAKQRARPFDTDKNKEEGEGGSKGDVGDGSSRASSQEVEDVGDMESEEEATDTPLSSQHVAVGDVHGGGKVAKSSAAADEGQDSVMADVDDEDEDARPTVRRAPVRTRGGFIIE